MTRTPILSYVYDRKKSATREKEAPVELRITYERRQKYMSTGVKLLPKHWRRGRVVDRLDAGSLNETLDLLMKDVRDIINVMLAEGSLNIFEIPSRMAEASRQRVSFIEFCYERCQVRKYGRSKDSQERYDRFMRYFVKWGKIMYFSDITDRNILLMDDDLRRTGMKNYSKWNNYHRFLNSFIIDAVAEGLVRRNPYKWLHIEKEKSSGGIGKYLTTEELHRIEMLEPPVEYLRRVRDVFIFQTYTCLSYTDLRSFDVANVKDIGGRKVYVSRRGKTKQEFTFLLLAPAWRILEKYNGRLPVISNIKYNAYLKVLAAMARIDKPVSSHWARHTGATMLLNAGMEMEVIAKILGHSSTKITRQVYAKLLDDTVVTNMRAFEDKLCL